MLLLENKLIIDALPTLTTQQDDISEADEIVENKPEVKQRGPNKSKKKWCIDFRRDYISKLIIIFIVSLIFGIIFGVAVVFTSFYDEFGLYLVCSKFTSGSILFWTVILMTFISHDTMTLIRANWRCRLNSWFDHYFVIHRFAAYLVTINGLIHSICHFTGSLRIISESNSVEDINKHMSRNVFTSQPEYWELLFKTIPGITGLIMLLIIFLMAISSMKWIREKCFQVFAYTHIIWYPIFLVAMIAHGFGFWFRMGTPYAVIFVTPVFILMIIQQLFRIFLSGVIYKFKIIDVSMSSDCSYAMIYFEKPKNYKLMHGQYVFF